jgi:hypothetical protein
MFAILEIVLVVVAIAIGANYLFRTRRLGEREAVTERRVEAYMQTIRREGTNPELTAMSDAELKDLLLSSAHNLKVDADRRLYALLGAGGVALIAAIISASQDGWRGFGIAILVGVVAIYGLSEFLGRKMREPLLERGIDVERLRVE